MSYPHKNRSLAEFLGLHDTQATVARLKIEGGLTPTIGFEVFRPFSHISFIRAARGFSLHGLNAWVIATERCTALIARGLARSSGIDHLLVVGAFGVCICLAAGIIKLFEQH